MDTIIRIYGIIQNKFAQRLNKMFRKRYRPKFSDRLAAGKCCHFDCEPYFFDTQAW